jgi:hypothetical protein
MGSLLFITDTAPIESYIGLIHWVSMKLRWAILVSMMMPLLLAQSSSAHIPIGGGGDSLDTAVWVNEPQNSWVSYTELDEPAEPQYFRFNTTAGTRIDLRLGMPIEVSSTAFRPVLVLMGPGLLNQSTPPVYLEIPEDAGVMVFVNEPEFTEFEGFTPSALYFVADIELQVPETGTYYVAVYEPTNVGRYTLVFGHIEVYTVLDWILIPFNTIMVHQWEGQNELLIFGPYVVAVVIGLILIFGRKSEKLDSTAPLAEVGLFASILIGATSASIAFQTFIALLGAPVNFLIVFTSLVILASLFGGYSGVRILLGAGMEEVRLNWWKLIIVGFIGLFLWAGYIIGPVLLIVVAIAPIILRTSAR